jgi:hypothetical protein
MRATHRGPSAFRTHHHLLTTAGREYESRMPAFPRVHHGSPLPPSTTEAATSGYPSRPPWPTTAVRPAVAAEERRLSPVGGPGSSMR